MKVYSTSEARQQFADVLNRARREGKVEIRRRNGQVFILRPTPSSGSPLDVPGINAGLSRKEVLELVRASRQSTERILKRTSFPTKSSRPGARDLRRKKIRQGQNGAR